MGILIYHLFFSSLYHFLIVVSFRFSICHFKSCFLSPYLQVTSLSSRFPVYLFDHRVLRCISYQICHHLKSTRQLLIAFHQCGKFTCPHTCVCDRQGHCQHLPLSASVSTSSTVSISVSSFDYQRHCEHQCQLLRPSPSSTINLSYASDISFLSFSRISFPSSCSGIHLVSNLLSSQVNTSTSHRISPML